MERHSMKWTKDCTVPPLGIYMTEGTAPVCRRRYKPLYKSTEDFAFWTQIFDNFLLQKEKIV